MNSDYHILYSERNIRNQIAPKITDCVRNVRKWCKSCLPVLHSDQTLLVLRHTLCEVHCQESVVFCQLEPSTHPVVRSGERSRSLSLVQPFINTRGELTLLWSLIKWLKKLLLHQSILEEERQTYDHKQTKKLSTYFEYICVGKNISCDTDYIFPNKD